MSPFGDLHGMQGRDGAGSPSYSLERYKVTWQSCKTFKIYTSQVTCLFNFADISIIFTKLRSFFLSIYFDDNRFAAIFHSS